MGEVAFRLHHQVLLTSNARVRVYLFSLKLAPFYGDPDM